MGRWESWCGQKSALAGRQQVNPGHAQGMSMATFSVIVIVFEIVPKSGFVILAAVKHTDDRNLQGVDGERNDRSALVVGDAQAGADVFALGTAQREGFKRFIIVDDRSDITLGEAGRSGTGDKTVQLGELFFRFRAIVCTQLFNSLIMRIKLKARIPSPSRGRSRTARHLRLDGLGWGWVGVLQD